MWYQACDGGLLLFFFFFQAEDGIRDVAVTGVQTCALRICRHPRPSRPVQRPERTSLHEPAPARSEIGRASCRERGEISVVAGSLKKKRGDVGGGRLAKRKKNRRRGGVRSRSALDYAQRRLP